VATYSCIRMQACAPNACSNGEISNILIVSIGNISHLFLSQFSAVFYMQHLFFKYLLTLKVSHIILHVSAKHWSSSGV
jgi:hypothetical protein